MANDQRALEFVGHIVQGYFERLKEYGRQRRVNDRKAFIVGLALFITLLFFSILLPLGYFLYELARSFG